MLFIHTIDKVLSGEKTQTRRLIKPPNDVPVWNGHNGEQRAIIGIGKMASMNVDRWVDVQYAVGKTYAVQPGRGKKSVARIQITGIRKEDVRQICDADIRAEGFLDENIAEAHLNFLAVWAGMHDKPLGFYRDDKRWHWDGTWGYKGKDGEHLADTVTAFCAFDDRPADRYTAWALTFKVVKP